MKDTPDFSDFNSWHNEKVDEIVMSLQRENRELRDFLENYQRAARLAVESWGDYSPKKNSAASTALSAFKTLLNRPVPETYDKRLINGDSEGEA